MIQTEIQKEDSQIMKELSSCRHGSQENLTGKRGEHGALGMLSPRERRCNPADEGRSLRYRRIFHGRE